MLRTQIKRAAQQATRARTQIKNIQASVVALENEDLLDLADIFSDKPDSSLGRLARTEMTKRGIAL